MRGFLNYFRFPMDEERRLAISSAISLPALIASFAMYRGHGHGGPFLSVETLYDPSWIPIILCGLPIITHAFKRLFAAGNIRAGLLMSLAIIAATISGELFAAGEVAFLLTVGELLEGRTLRKAREGIQALVALAPRTASVLRGGREVTVEADSLALGDVVRIRPGETVPVDGTIVTGATSIDQAVITGESIPVDKAAGDVVMAGTINLFGSMDVRTDKTAGDSTLQRMIKLVRDAQERRAPVVRLADKWATILVPTALLTAVAVWAVTGEVIRAVTILVVFCPCALALATPTAVMAAIANLSRHGVLVKSGEALEAMGRMTTIAFDKTGTLTYGKPAVSEVFAALPGLDEEGLLSIAASAERRSEHPLGKAIAAALPDAADPSAFEMLPGKGVFAEVGGRKVYIGALDWLASRGATPDARSAERAERARKEGHALVGVEVDGEFAGLVMLSDTVRSDSRAAVSRLRAEGVRRMLLLTGDHEAAARRIAEVSGVDAVEFDLLPEDKVSHVMRLAAEGKGVAMVGDGVNDAPALKSATVGIAMGGVGSDIAIEAADVVLMRDDIRLLPHLLRMSRSALSNIAINISISLLLNGAAIALAAKGLLGPAVGALVHNAGSVFVVAHAATLLRHKP